MPRPLIPDTASRACIPASLQPCNQLEKECYASLPRGTVTDVAAEHSVSHNEPLEIMMRKPSLGSANSSCYVDITIQLCLAEKMNAR
jgi:hypothetical protein